MPKFRSGNDNFMYNSMLASALVQLLPLQERRIIRAWIDRLHSVTDPKQLPIRNDYMWFLLLILQKKRITLPFSSMPVGRELEPLKTVLPAGVYDDVINTSAGSANLEWIDQVMSRGAAGGGEAPLRPHTTSAPPKQFLTNQPRPRTGIICYMGAFSDQQK